MYLYAILLNGLESVKPEPVLQYYLSTYTFASDK
jgi:hypothetical protein